MDLLISLDHEWKSWSSEEEGTCKGEAVLMYSIRVYHSTNWNHKNQMLLISLDHDLLISLDHEWKNWSSEEEGTCKKSSFRGS
jgi:hypothetical protein